MLVPAQYTLEVHMICYRSRRRDSPIVEFVSPCRASSNRPSKVTYLAVNEEGIADLLVLETEQQNFLHHCQLRLLLSLSGFVHIPGVESNLVAILAVFVARLGTEVSNIGG